MHTSRTLLAALVLSLAACAGHNSSWHYKSTDDKAITHGRAGQNLSITSEGVTVTFQAPSGWKIVDSMEEPLDWDYAADAPKDERQFGVVVRADKQVTTAGCYRAYLQNVHSLYDPKVRMQSEAAFTLKDGRTVTPYRYYSEYWKQRLVIIIPEGKAATVFEFTAPTLESLRSSRTVIQQMLNTYTSQPKRK